MSLAKKKIFIYSVRWRSSFPWKRKTIFKLGKFFLFLVLFFTVAVNVAFIVETTKRFDVDAAARSGPSDPGSNPDLDPSSVLTDQESGSDRLTKSRRSNQLKLQESVAKFLTIDVVSSKSKAAVTVDGTTVSWTGLRTGDFHFAI